MRAFLLVAGVTLAIVSVLSLGYGTAVVVAARKRLKAETGKQMAIESKEISFFGGWIAALIIAFVMLIPTQIWTDF